MTIERDSVQIAEEPSTKELLREFYAFKGIDIDQRVPRPFDESHGKRKTATTNSGIANWKLF